MEIPNLLYIEQLSGDNLEFKNKMINILKTELPYEINYYKVELEKKNFLIAAQVVHRLKHKIAILGLEKSYYLAETFEENLKNKNTQLQNEFEFILESISNFVLSLK